MQLAKNLANFFDGIIVASHHWTINTIAILVLLMTPPLHAETDYQSKFEAAAKLSQSSSEQDLKQAETEWSALLDQYPNDLAASNNLAVTQMKLKKYTEAQQTLEAALNAEPKIAMILENLNALYAYQAQLAYKSVFKSSKLQQPQGQWMALSAQAIKTPDQARINQLQQGLETVVNAVENWRSAWSRQDYESYLKFYKNDFHSSQFADHQSWRQGRKYSLSNPKYIKINLTNIEAMPLSENLIEVVFYQAYESNRFKDTVKKQLIWQKTDGGWRIVKERVIYE